MSKPTFASLMPQEVLNTEELLQIQGGDNPPKPVSACSSGVCLLGDLQEKAALCTSSICISGL